MRKSTARVVLVVLLCLTICRTALAQPRLEVPPAPDEGTVRIVLDNGLEVLIQPDRTHPRVAVSVSYGVGLRHEPRGYRGIAHLVERLMPQGSRNVGPGELQRVLDGIGGLERDSETTLDRTTFWEVVPSHQLAQALWLESDRMAFLLDRVDARALERQRAVVTREHATRVEGDLGPLLQWIVTRRLLPRGHPYRDAGDDPRDLEVVRLEHVQWFFQSWFGPGNARLAIVGDVDVAVARDLVERYFGTIAAHPTPIVPVPARLPDTEFRARYVTFGWRDAREHLAAVWRTPAAFQPGDAELDVIAEVLAGGRGSRLVERLVHEEGLATSVVARQESRQIESVFVIEAAPAPGRGVAEAILSVVDDELARLVAEPPGDAELVRARSACRTKVLSRFESLAVRARTLAGRPWPDAADGVYRRADDLARYDRVTAGGVQDVAQRFLVPEGRLLVLFEPWHYAPPAGALIGDEVRR